MKQITICGKEYTIECNALTYIKYKSFFKTGIIKDMQFVQKYLINQVTILDNLKDKKIKEEEKIEKVSDAIIDDTDEFITKITQIAWILIYTADNKIEDYEKWLSSLTDFKIDADWIVEVTEFAVNCFC